MADKSKKSGKPDKSDKSGKSNKEFAVDIVQVVYTTTMDDGSVVPLNSPLVVVAGRNLGREDRLTVTLANNLIVLDVDDDRRDNLFSFVLPTFLLDGAGIPISGDYLLEVASGKSKSKQASHLLTIDSTTSGLSIS